MGISNDTRDEPIIVTDARPWQIWVARDLWTCEALTLCQKGVYTLLCGYADIKTRECYPSVGRIAKELGIAKHTARDAMDGLVKHGLLRREYRRAKDDRVNDTNLYTILPFTAPPTLAAAVGQQLPYGNTCPTAAAAPGYGSGCPTVGQQLPTNETHVTKPIELDPEVSGAAAPAPAARRNPAHAEQFSAILEAAYVPAEKVSEYRGEANKVAKDLSEKGYGRAAILAGRDAYLERYEDPDKVLTIPALGRWIPRLVNPDGSPVRCASPPRQSNDRPTRQVQQEVSDAHAREFGQARPAEVAAKYARYERQPGSGG